jgi:hypothetical protein
MARAECGMFTAVILYMENRILPNNSMATCIVSINLQSCYSGDRQDAHITVAASSGCKDSQCYTHCSREFYLTFSKSQMAEVQISGDGSIYTRTVAEIESDIV